MLGTAPHQYIAHVPALLTPPPPASTSPAPRNPHPFHQLVGNSSGRFFLLLPYPLFLFFNTPIFQLAGLPHPASNSQWNFNTSRSYPAVPETRRYLIVAACRSAVHLLPVTALQLKSDASGEIIPPYGRCQDVRKCKRKRKRETRPKHDEQHRQRRQRPCDRVRGCCVAARQDRQQQVQPAATRADADRQAGTLFVITTAYWTT